MAGPRPMANTVQILVKGDFNGKQCLNTFYFKYASVVPPTETDLSQLIDAWILNNQGAFRDCVSTDYKIIEYVAIDLGSVPQTSVSRLISPAAAGTRGGAVSAGNVAVGLKRKTSHRGRSYRGRIEVPAIVNNDVVRDIISSALQALLAILAGKLLDRIGSIGGGQFIPSAGSYKLIQSNPIVAWVFDLVSDSQKTRLLTHGD